MPKFDVAVIGGGASGIAAAISAKRLGKSVVICEKMPRIGKKILASGNGRCNLLNDDLSEEYYNPAARPLIRNTFSKFGKDKIADFFGSLGLSLYSENGRIFPSTNQSASVLRVLELELGRLAIPAEVDFDVVSVTDKGEGFILTAGSGSNIESGSLIISGGGRSYPALGSDGSAFLLAEKFGHNIIEPVPSAVPLVVKDPLCHALQGQKITAKVTALVEGRAVCEASGDLLFTKYGLSGTSILDVSEEISIALTRAGKKDVIIEVDMVPFMTKSRLSAELKRKMTNKIAREDMTAGMLPNKFGAVINAITHDRQPDAMADALKGRLFKVSGTRGWNEADFTAGGVDVSEVIENSLESKIRKGLYFAGEVLDVNGKRGGYNLAWAWASGFVAGQTK
ncbi:MAG: aminoacetone oxidase family FAD-binding enzyme [Candidatus Omnitrophota bacterium]